MALEGEPQGWSQIEPGVWTKPMAEVVAGVEAAQYCATEPLSPWDEGVTPNAAWAQSVELPSFLHPIRRTRVIRAIAGQLPVGGRNFGSVTFTRLQLIELADMHEKSAATERFYDEMEMLALEDPTEALKQVLRRRQQKEQLE